MFFAQNIKHLRVLKRLTQGHLAEAIGVKTNTISNYENGKSEPEFGILERIVKFLDVDAHDFLYTDLAQTIFQTKCEENVVKKNDHDNAHENDHIPNVKKTWSNAQTKNEETPINGNDRKNDREIEGLRNENKNLSNINTDDTVAIPITDVSAAAGGGAFNADHHETNGAIQLPRSMLKRGTHLCVSVDGRSMEPTLQNGSMVVIRHVDRNEWAYLKDSSLYVITDREGSTYIKRITNNLRLNGELVLRSDNSDKRRFSNITLSEDELFNIWAVEWCLSSAFPEAYAEVNERLDLIEGGMTEITSLVRAMARDAIKKP